MDSERRPGAGKTWKSTIDTNANIEPILLFAPVSTAKGFRVNGIGIWFNLKTLTDGIVAGVTKRATVYQKPLE